MRMRIAICLVVGVSTTCFLPVPAGAQISDTRNASEAQYPDVPKRQADPVPSAKAPAAAETPTDDGGLPFTGFVAIPLLVTGVALLLAGGVMHVRTRDR